MVDDGRTPDHGHPISSPCEPNGSGELKSVVFFSFAIKIRNSRVEAFRQGRVHVKSKYM